MKRGFGWTLFSTHGLVLLRLARGPDVTIEEMATDLGISLRQVNTVLGDLDRGGMIRRTRVGRRNRYSVVAEARLRHPLLADVTVGDVVRMIGGAPARPETPD